MPNPTISPHPNRSNATRIRHLRGFLSPLFVCTCVALAAHAAAAQASVAPGGALIVSKADLPTPINQPPDANVQMMKHQDQDDQKRFDAVNNLRRQRITEEASQLLTLARDLQARLDKVGKDQVPAALIRDSEMIELLAHDVQQKMVLTVQ